MPRSRELEVLRDLAAYPSVYNAALRYRDVDRYDHVNNGAIADMIETARADFHRDLGLETLRADAMEVVVSQSFDYLSEVRPPSPLSVGVAVAAVGRASWTVVQLAVQDGRPCVTARCTLVHLRGGATVLIDEQWRLRLAGATLASAPRSSRTGEG